MDDDFATILNINAFAWIYNSASLKVADIVAFVFCCDGTDAAGVFLIDTYVIYKHLCGESIHIDALLSTPVTAPGEIQDDVEGRIIWPVVTSQTAIGVIQLFLAIDISGDPICRPLDGIDMITVLSTLAEHLMSDLSAVRMNMSVGMKA